MRCQGAWLSFKALHGTIKYFLPWSVLWLTAAYKTWYYARARDFVWHRRWANFLSQSALLFISGRLSIFTFKHLLGYPGRETYYYSVGAAAVVALLRFIFDMVHWRALVTGFKATKNWNRTREEHDGTWFMPHLGEMKEAASTRIE